VLAADEVGNRVFSAVAAGLWTLEHADLLSPYVDRYLAEAPAWAARRGQGFTLAIGLAFPRFAVTTDTRDALTAALDGDVPSLLRRYWNDRLDDLQADLAVRRGRRTSR
jgi:aminopeptidase N